MKTPENIKIKRRLVGLKRLPTLIEINDYKCPVPMYYVFRLDPITRDTKLLSLTVTDSWGNRVKCDTYSTLGLNTGSLKETSLVGCSFTDWIVFRQNNFLCAFLRSN